MSISYNVTDEKLPEKQKETNSEYELRVEKAKKELEDILELTERKSILTRRSSLSDTPTRRINLARASVGSASKAEEEQEKRESEADEDEPKSMTQKIIDWWTRTDQAFLNERPDKAISEEAGGDHDRTYNYTPQYDVSHGAHRPSYLEKSVSDSLAAH